MIDQQKARRERVLQLLRKDSMNKEDRLDATSSADTDDFHLTRTSGTETAGNVDYSPDPSLGTCIVPMPDSTPDLKTTARQVAALANVVKKRYSLAIATGHADLEQVARLPLTNKESQVFKMWKEGKVDLRSINLGAKSYNTDRNNEKRMERYASAMNTIWNAGRRFSSMNAAWLVDHLPWAVSLITAIMKEEIATTETKRNKLDHEEADQDQHMNSLTDLERRELEICRVIRNIADANIVQSSALSKVVFNELCFAKSLIQEREKALESKLEAQENFGAD